MHLELVVPGLLPAEAEAPALALLLARGRRAEAAPAALEPWLARAFALDGEALPAGALSAHAAGLDAAAGHWLRADPVHLRADRDRLLLIPAEGFSIAAAEAAALAEALGKHYANEFSLHVLRPDLWCLRSPGEMAVRARPPLEIAGRDVDPELPDQRFHALLNEMQMALYQHPVNTAREARGEPVVNGLWLWGAGALPAAPQVPWASLSAEEPAALGLAKLAGLRHRAPGPEAAAWLERAPDDGRHLVLLEELRGAQALGDAAALADRLAALEVRWFAPLLAALRAGRIGMLTVHAPEAGLAFETARGDLRRFWRRPRPLSAWGGARA
jgi:hypothetical protein